LYRFEEYGHAERDEEYSIDKGTQCLGSLPLCAISVSSFSGGNQTYTVSIHLGARLLPSDLDRPQTNTQGENIIEHVERVGDESERMDGISDKELQEEEDGVDSQ